MSKNGFPWRVSPVLMSTAVAIWFLIVIAANLTPVRNAIFAPTLDPSTANVVASVLAAALLVTSFLIWTGALHHFQSNAALSGQRRRAWAVIVWGWFVFGGLAYYLYHMRRVRVPAA